MLGDFTGHPGCVVAQLVRTPGTPQTATTPPPRPTVALQWCTRVPWTVTVCPVGPGALG